MEKKKEGKNDVREQGSIDDRKDEAETFEEKKRR